MTLEELRVFSHLSEAMHHIDTPQGEYTCIGGLAMPRRLATVFALWVMTGYQYYQSQIDPADIELLRSINEHNEDLKNPSYKPIAYIFGKISSIMAKWSHDDFEGLMISTDRNS